MYTWKSQRGKFYTPTWIDVINLQPVFLEVVNKKEFKRFSWRYWKMLAWMSCFLKKEEKPSACTVNFSCSLGQSKVCKNAIYCANWLLFARIYSAQTKLLIFSFWKQKSQLLYMNKRNWILDKRLVCKSDPK